MNNHGYSVILKNEIGQTKIVHIAMPFDEGYVKNMLINTHPDFRIFKIKKVDVPIGVPVIKYLQENFDIDG